MSYLKECNRNLQFKPRAIVHGEDEDIVQDGLALTPAEVLEMVNRGIPISNSNLPLMEVYKTGDDDFSVPMEFRRNADMADMWEHREMVRDKIRDGVSEHHRRLKFEQQLKESSPSVEPPKTD